MFTKCKYINENIITKWIRLKIEIYAIKDSELFAKPNPLVSRLRIFILQGDSFRRNKKR